MNSFNVAREAAALLLVVLLAAAPTAAGRGLRQTTPAPGATQGAKLAGGGGFGSFSKLDGVGCNGPTIGAPDAASRWSCQYLCSQNGECQAYSFNVEKSQCFLKSEPCTDRDDNPNNLSGARGELVALTFDAGAPLPASFSPLASVGCNGPTLESLPVAGPGDCESLCSLNEACQAFSFNIEKGVCYLKSDPCTDQDDNPNNISGARIAAVFERLDEVGCNGETLKILRDVEDRETCELRCSANSECLSYSWNSEDKKCFLKSELCSSDLRDDNPNNMSGSKIMP